jgi:hypothetical protein
MQHACAVLGIAPALARQPASVSAEDRLFIALLNGYRSSGGLNRFATLQAARRDDWGNDVVQEVPARVAERRVLGIVWNRDLWVPDFQFDRSGAIKPVAAAVFLELTASHDPGELAAWFVTPSTWLRDVRPIELIETAPSRVIEAARADRYVADGG